MSKGAVLFCPTKNWGGIEKNVRLRAKFLSEKNYKIYVVLLKNTFEEKFSGIPNVSIETVTKRGGDLNIFVVLHYVKLLKKVRPHVVFAALKRDWWLVALSAFLTKVPNKILYLGNKRIIRKGLKYSTVFKILKAKVLVNSNSLKEHLLSTSSYFNSNNLFRIYNGIELPEINGITNDYRTKLGLDKNTYIIGCAGWLNYRKGFDLLPDILKKLPENFHIVHHGTGGFELDVDKMILENKAIAHRMHFLGHENKMEAFFRGIDIFLLCSRSEGMANVLNEALSHGKPIISAKVPGSEELLHDGVYGILTNIEDTNAMVEGIKDLYNGKVNFSPENQRKRISTSFSLEIMKKATEKLFFS